MLLLVLQTCGKKATLGSHLSSVIEPYLMQLLQNIPLELITKACKETIVNKHCTPIYLNCYFKTDQICAKGNQTSVIKNKVGQKCAKYCEHSILKCALEA